jgi:hypothetical protein
MKPQFEIPLAGLAPLAANDKPSPKNDLQHYATTMHLSHSKRQCLDLFVQIILAVAGSHAECNCASNWNQILVGRIGLALGGRGAEAKAKCPLPVNIMRCQKVTMIYLCRVFLGSGKTSHP